MNISDVMTSDALRAFVFVSIVTAMLIETDIIEATFPRLRISASHLRT